MVRVAPLSPPSSTGELQNGFQHLIQYNSSSAYPYDNAGYNGEQFHSGTQSSYGSPAPVYRSIGYHYGGIQASYPYSNQWQDHGGAGVRYEGLSPGSSHYAAIQSDQKLSQYNSPSGSPPTSTMSTPASDPIRTRSGLAISRSQSHKPLPQSANSVSSSPKIRKARRERGKTEKKVARLDKPLSELTKDWTHVPVVDIESYVNRPAEVRRKEVEDGKMPGRVKRPMNSFMLYRKAYQNRCKHWCLQNNHQVVSQVCGDSWPLEPDSVREQFNEWARIERINHQNAHPGYKFSPSKAGNNNKCGKRKVQEDIMSEESDLDDYDWEREHVKRNKPSKHRSRASEDTPRSRTGSPYGILREVSEEPSYDVYNMSSYHLTNPGKQVPAQYSRSNLNSSQYYQQTVQQHTLIPGVEDIVIKKHATPGMHFLGLPGGQDLMDPYHSQEGAQTPDYKIDPSLMDHDAAVYDNKFSGQAGVYIPDSLGNNTFWQDQYGAGESFEYLDASHPLEHLQIHDQHLQMFKGSQDDWQVESLDAGQEFDKWMDEKGAIP